jgi:hypothetical protein
MIAFAGKYIIVGLLCQGSARKFVIYQILPILKPTQMPIIRIKYLFFTSIKKHDFLVIRSQVLYNVRQQIPNIRKKKDFISPIYYTKDKTHTKGSNGR